MRLTKKLASVGSTVLLTATFGLVAAPAAHAAVAPLDPTQWSVACDSVVGTIKFATAINLAPSTTDNTITVKATVSGCTVPEADGAEVAPGVNGPGPAQGSGDPFSCVLPGVKHQSTVADGITTSGSPNISAASGPFLPTDAGQFITGVGIPANTLVSTVTDSSHAILSQNATASTSPTPLKPIKFTLALGTPNQPCVNIAPTKLSAVLTSLAGHNNFYNSLSDGHTTSGSKNISCASCNFNTLEAGNSITGAGIPNSAGPSFTTIASVTNAHNAVMSANATATATNVHFAHGDSSGCLGLQGLSTGTSGPEIAQFKNQSKGLDNATPLPKLLDPTDANVTGTVNSTLGGTFTAPWGSYGEFSVGASFGTNVAARNTGAFQGGDNGANDLFQGSTGESSGAILTACLGKGVKAIDFGVGHVAFG